MSKNLWRYFSPISPTTDGLLPSVYSVTTSLSLAFKMSSTLLFLNSVFSKTHTFSNGSLIRASAIDFYDPAAWVKQLCESVCSLSNLVYWLYLFTSPMFFPINDLLSIDFGAVDYILTVFLLFTFLLLLNFDGDFPVESSPRLFSY